MFYRFVKLVGLILYLSGLYFLTMTDSRNGRLDVVCAGLGLGLCALYFLHISRMLNHENARKAKASGLVDMLLCVSFVALSCLGNTFNSSYALIQGGQEPRISNSTVFLRWPWERYSKQELNPKGSQFSVKGSYLLPESEPMAGTGETEITIQYEFAWTNEDLRSDFDSEAAESFFRSTTSKAIMEAHKKLGLNDISLDHGIMKFQALIRNDLSDRLNNHGYRLEAFNIVTFDIKYP